MKKAKSCLGLTIIGNLGVFLVLVPVSANVSEYINSTVINLLVLVFVISLVAATIIGITALRNVETLNCHEKIMTIIGLSISGVELFLLILTSFISCDNNKEKLDRIRCAQNIKQIGIVLQQYASNNHGFYPDGNTVAAFKKLRQGKFLSDNQIFMCPACIARNKKATNLAVDSITEKNISYIYSGSGLTVDNNPDTIILCDKEGNHKKYCNTFSLGGTVQGYASFNYIKMEPIWIP